MVELVDLADDERGGSRQTRFTVMKPKLMSLGLALILASHTLAETFSAEELQKRNIARRAVEAVIWGMPAVNTDLMRQEMFRKTSGKENEVLYWSRPVDANNQTLTPNPDCIYFMTFYNTEEVGPVVIELPPGSGRIVRR